MLAYAIMGLAVYCMMQSLGEMATQLPIPGSFEAYAERFIDPSFSFAVGWNYWFSWSITLAAELVAGSLIVQFWFPHSNSTLWAMGFFAVLLALNLLSVKAYAEAEYWFAGIKVVTVVIFLAVGALMIAGMLGERSVGFQNWTLSDAANGTHAPFVGGGMAVLAVFLVAGFSFQGTEGVGLAAAETADPRKNVPKAIRTVFWRILLFYIGSIFVIGTLIAYTDPNLLHGDEGPHCLLAVHDGVPGAAALRLLHLEHHERGHPVLRALLWKFVHVRGIAHAACHGPQPQGAAGIRRPQPARRARGRAARHRPGERHRLFLDVGGRAEDLPAVLQRLEPERLPSSGWASPFVTCAFARHGLRRAAA